MSTEVNSTESQKMPRFSNILNINSNYINKNTQSTVSSAISNSPDHIVRAEDREQVSIIKEAYTKAVHLARIQGLASDCTDINTTINITEMGVRRIIFFFKLIPNFHDLPHDLMLKLLKQNMMSLLQIHGVNSYDRSQNTFKQPDTDDVPFTAESLKTAYGEELYEITMSITNNLYDLCKGNMTLVKLVMLVVLFDPQNELLDDNEKNLIEELQNKYITLLYSYICDTQGASHVEFTFKSLIVELNKISDLSKLFERAVVEKSNYESVRPLMKEIFLFSNLVLCQNLKNVVL